MKHLRLLSLAFAGLFYCLPAIAQNSGAVPQYAVPIGQGLGHTGFGAAAPGSAGQALLSTGPTSAPVFGSVAGASFGNQNANKVYGGPATGADALPSFRALVNADFPTVDLAHGGTNATSAATARTSLGLAIGSNVQAWDADLDAFALKTAPAGAVVGTTDTQTLTGKTFNCASNTCTVRLGSDVTGTLPVANGGTGAATLSAALDAAFSSTQGSILYRGASGWVSLGPGTSGWFLKTQGAAANPIWTALPAGGDMLASNNLSDLTNAGTALTNLGGTTTGKALFTTASQSAAQTTLGLGNIAVKNLSEQFVYTNATASSGTGSGAIVVTGGVGVGGAVYVGDVVGAAKSIVFSGDPRFNPQIKANSQTGFSITNGGNATITNGDGYFDLDISSTSIGSHCRWLTGNGTAVLDATQVGSFCVASTGSPSAGKWSIAYVGGFGYTIYNNSGSTAVFRVVSKQTN